MPAENNDDVEVEYVPEALPQDEALFQEFAHVFQKFSNFNPSSSVKQEQSDKKQAGIVAVPRKAGNDDEDDQEDADKDKDDENRENESNKGTLQKTKGPAGEQDAKERSKRKLKQLTRLSVAELKQKVARPELVESHDVTARDPIFLLHLKSTKNSVPVPRHWGSKRRYLQGKRGYEKPPFLLPDFIRQTGIMEMRDSAQDKEGAKSLKAKTRERVQPKMGKIQMDYQQLHDAFFKWQTRPIVSIHGDLYYEGKEFERKFKKKPGELSNELRKVLGMPVGPNANRYPPPWLTAMRRHGPPPSYPYLKIPGLNCPFPDGNDEEEDEETGQRHQDGSQDMDTNVSDEGD